MNSAAAAQTVRRNAPRLGPGEVVVMLDTLAAADSHLAEVLDGVVSSRVRVSWATVAALERVLATLRPAADVRAQLARVDRRVLAAAIRLRRDRYDRLRVIDGGGLDDRH
jgi:hypothetical protein